MMDTIWTDDRVAKLTASWNAGHSAREIATALSEPGKPPITRNSVISKAHRLGLRMHLPPNSWRETKSGRPRA